MGHGAVFLMDHGSNGLMVVDLAGGNDGGFFFVSCGMGGRFVVVVVWVVGFRWVVRC